MNSAGYLKNALNALRQIAKVEDVVRLRRRRQQLSAHTRVDLHGGVDDAIAGSFDVLVEVGEVPVENGLEDMLQTVLGRRGNGEDGEMTEQTRSGRITTTAGWTARSAKDHILDVDPLERLSVEHTVQVLILSQQFAEKQPHLLPISSPAETYMGG